MDPNRQLYYSIVRLVDVVIEHEGAFGMKFGPVDFEARGKCGNSIAYPRFPHEAIWTPEIAAEVVENVREYLKEKLNVKDET